MVTSFQKTVKKGRDVIIYEVKVVEFWSKSKNISVIKLGVSNIFLIQKASLRDTGAWLTTVQELLKKTERNRRKTRD